MDVQEPLIDYVMHVLFFGERAYDEVRFAMAMYSTCTGMKRVLILVRDVLLNLLADTSNFRFVFSHVLEVRHFLPVLHKVEKEILLDGRRRPKILFVPDRDVNDILESYDDISGSKYDERAFYLLNCWNGVYLNRDDKRLFRRAVRRMMRWK